MRLERTVYPADIVAGTGNQTRFAEHIERNLMKGRKLREIGAHVNLLRLPPVAEEAASCSHLFSLYPLPL